MRKSNCVATTREFGVRGVGDGWSRSIQSTHEKRWRLRSRAGTVFCLAARLADRRLRGLRLGEMEGGFVVYGKCAPLPIHSENLGGLPLHRAAILRWRMTKDTRLDPAALVILHRSRMTRAAAHSFS